MQFDLGLKFLTMVFQARPVTFIGTIKEIGSNYTVEINTTDGEGNEKAITLQAKPLLHTSVSYEPEDKVYIEIRSFCEAYVIGLAQELEDTDTTTEFHVRLGKNTFHGTKDGTSLKFEAGDGQLTISHDVTGTKIECTGLVTVSGDMISVGNGTAPSLNACTACPLTGVHAPTVTTILIG